MTYLLGLLQEGVAAIISDNRATINGRIRDGANIALKSGILFPGCIYGAAGNAHEARRFLRYCGRNLNDKLVSPSGWDEFLALIDAFGFNERRSFQLLLSSRHHGGPRLYFFESSGPVLNEVSDGFAVGSGCTLLNDSFSRIHSSNGPTVAKRANREFGLPLADFPYLYCLLLMERIKGTEVSALESAGVGGYFHFLHQTSDGEWNQKPALYLVHSCRFRHLWVFRIAFEGPALVIHDGDLPRPAVMINSKDWVGVAEMGQDELGVLGREIVAKAQSEQGYYFCGLGFAEPHYRGNNLVGLWKEGEEMFSPSDGGKLSQSVRQFIDTVCNGQTGRN